MFADAVLDVLTYLRPVLAARSETELTGLVVADRVPQTRDPLASPPLLVFRRIGGTSSRYEVRDFPRLDYMVWHRTEFEAMKVANIVRWVMLHLPAGTQLNGHTVYRVDEFLGPTRMPDPAGSSADIVMGTLEVPLRVA